MKKLFTLTLSCFLLLISAHSFAAKIDTLKNAAKNKAKTAATKAKTTAATATTNAKTTVATTSTTADKKAADVKTNASTKVATTKVAAADGSKKVADKVIGTDAKGKSVYLGAKGGQYTLSPAGKKVYLKTSEKLKVK